MQYDTQFKKIPKVEGPTEEDWGGDLGGYGALRGSDGRPDDGPTADEPPVAVPTRQKTLTGMKLDGPTVAADDDTAKSLMSGMGGTPKNDFDPGKYMVSPEDMQQARDTKLQAAKVGQIGNILSNSQSFGNYFLGHMNPHQDVSGYAKAVGDAAEGGIQDKQALLKQEMQKPDLQNTQDLMDPNSDISNATRQMAKTQLAVLKQKLGRDNPTLAKAFTGVSDSLDDMGGYKITNIFDKLGFNKMLGQEALSGDKVAQMVASLAFGREKFGINTDIKRDNQTASAAGKVNNNSVLNTMDNQIRQNGRALDLLSRPQTRQEFNDSLLEFQKAVSGGGGGGALGNLERTEYSSAAADMGNIVQHLTGNPQEDVPPKMQARLLGVMTKFNASMQRERDKKAGDLKVNFASNPSANEAQDNAITNRTTAAPQAAPDQDVLDYAKAHGITPEAAQALKQARTKGAQ